MPERTPEIPPKSERKKSKEVFQHRSSSAGGDCADGSCPISEGFSWLNWAPAKGTTCFDTLHRCFPGALPGDAIRARSAEILEERFGMDPDNTLYGQSICPDEINNEDGDLASHMYKHWGEVYPMGGIGGAPYVGKTGFSEFASHVPEAGNLLVLFGPHIAISDTGELGKYLRIGQAHHSGACGAVLAAFNSCRDGLADDFDADDMQQCWLKSKINLQLDRIQRSEFPMHTLINVAYECVKEKLLDIVHTSFGSGKLAIIGGIQLNMPAPFRDHFQPLFFEIRSKDAPPVDLMPAFEYVHADPALYGVREHPERRLGNIFSWMGWAPTPDSPIFKTLHECFPGALPGQAVVSRTAKILDVYGLDGDNTLYGQSICPDEINNHDSCLANLMKEFWGEVFPMGGIGGAPFVGKTGFMAFSHHVPDDGHVLIMFGPHISISEEGELGKFVREGQTQDSLSCGALLNAYNDCRDVGKGNFDPNDMQQCWIKETILEHIDRINAAPEPLPVLLHVAFESIREKLLRIVNTHFGTGRLVLLGGIQINLPAPYADHFQPIFFQVTSQTSPYSDLLPTFARDYDLKTPNAHAPPPPSDAADATEVVARDWAEHPVVEGLATKKDIEGLREEMAAMQVDGRRVASLLERVEALFSKDSVGQEQKLIANSAQDDSVHQAANAQQPASPASVVAPPGSFQGSFNPEPKMIAASAQDDCWLAHAVPQTVSRLKSDSGPGSSGLPAAYPCAPMPGVSSPRLPVGLEASSVGRRSPLLVHRSVGSSAEPSRFPTPTVEPVSPRGPGPWVANSAFSESQPILQSAPRMPARGLARGQYGVSSMPSVFPGSSQLRHRSTTPLMSKAAMDRRLRRQR